MEVNAAHALATREVAQTLATDGDVGLSAAVRAAYAFVAALATALGVGAALAGTGTFGRLAT